MATIVVCVTPNGIALATVNIVDCPVTVDSKDMLPATGKATAQVAGLLAKKLKVELGPRMAVTGSGVTTKGVGGATGASIAITFPFARMYSRVVWASAVPARVRVTSRYFREHGNWIAVFIIGLFTPYFFTTD